MRFSYQVDFDVERQQGKFASREEIEEKIREELEGVQPNLSGLGANGDSEYEITSGPDVSEYDGDKQQLIDKRHHGNMVRSHQLAIALAMALDKPDYFIGVKQERKRATAALMRHLEKLGAVRAMIKRGADRRASERRVRVSDVTMRADFPASGLLGEERAGERRSVIDRRRMAP